MARCSGGGSEIGVRRRLLALTSLLVFSEAIALRSLTLRNTSWFIDEFVTRNTGRLSFWRPGALDASLPAAHSVVSFTLHDGPGPFTYVLDGLFASQAYPLGGEFWLRLPGIAAGCMTVLLILVFGKRCLGSSEGACAMAAFGAALPAWIDWSGGARGYSWGVLIAMMQFGLMMRLSFAASTPMPRRANWLWILLVAATIAGWMTNPYHMLWSTGILAGVLYARFKLNRAQAAQLSAASLGLGIGAAALPYAVWLLLWIPRISARGATPGSNAITGSVQRLLQALSVRSTVVALAECASLVTVCCWAWRKRALRPGVVCCAAACPMFALLCAVLSARFVAGRYFYALTVLLCWFAGYLTQECCALIRLRLGASSAKAVFLALIAAMLVLPLKQAIWLAVTPVHNWAEAVRWLKPRVRKTDVVFLGPNADFEVFSAYAGAAGLAVASPRWIFDENGRRYDAQREAGIAFALKSGRRLWFLTPFWGAVRPPSFWDYVSRNFVEAALIPGRTPIRIMVHDP